MKKILTLLTATLIITNCTMAHECVSHVIPKKTSFKEQRQFDKLINEKLNLSEEQIEILKKNRSQHKKNMEKIIKEMQELHDQIRDVYLTGIPKFQADLRTAPLKAHLVALKQNANKLKQEHRKAFESVLTQEQKNKFEILKKEIFLDKQNKKQNHN